MLRSRKYFATPGVTCSGVSYRESFSRACTSRATGLSRRGRDPWPAVPRTVLLNPLVTPLSQDVEEGWEGCLSVPGLRGAVNRYTLIRYQGIDPSGAPIDRRAEGFHARVVQHECDHLIGRLYPSRITDFSKFGYTGVLFPDIDPAVDE